MESFEEPNTKINEKQEFPPQKDAAFNSEFFFNWFLY